MTAGSSRQRKVRRHAGQVDALHRVGEDESAALEDLEQRLQAVLREVALAGASGQGREGSQDVVLADLGERLASGFDPRLHDRREALDVDLDGLGFAGQLARCLSGSAEHDLKPQLEVLPHRVREGSGLDELGAEAPLNPGRRDVLDQEPGFGEDVEGGGDGAVVAAQRHDVTGADLRGGSGRRICSSRRDWITALRCLTLQP